MLRNTRPTVPLAALLLASCSSPAPEAAPQASPEIPVVEAELIATDGSWGYTEGPAVDSKGALYFTSLGTYKGIINWTEKGGAEKYAAVATMGGPWGLWIDDADNIYLTAHDEREVQELAPDGTVTTIAKGFEADPATANGPNDITVSKSGVVYFTNPNGYSRESAPGTVYRIDAAARSASLTTRWSGPTGSS